MLKAQFLRQLLHVIIAFEISKTDIKNRSQSKLKCPQVSVLHPGEQLAGVFVLSCSNGSQMDLKQHRMLKAQFLQQLLYV